MRFHRAGSLAWLPELSWLVLVWALLWGSATPLALLGGLTLSVVAVWIARLPPQAPFAGRLRPVALVVFLADFVGDLFSSAVQVSWQAVRPGRPAPSAIVAVPVRAHSGGLLLITANTISLTPGSIAVDLDQGRRQLFVHGFPVGSQREADDLRRFAVRIEERAARAIGSPQDVQAAHGQAAEGQAAEREEQR